MIHLSVLGAYGADLLIGDFVHAVLQSEPLDGRGFQSVALGGSNHPSHRPYFCVLPILEG